MALDEDLSRFIGRIYESVYEPAPWKAVINELMRRTGSRIAFISSVDLCESNYNRALFYAPEESSVDTGMREYVEETYLMDPSLAWASNHPGAGVCATEAIIPKSDYLAHPFITWQRSRFGTTHWRVLYTPPVDGFSFALSLHPPQGADPPSKDLLPLHRLLFEHMERALRLAARPPDFSRDEGAVVALDRFGRVMAMSPRAEQIIDGADGLSLDSCRLAASCADCEEKLKRAIRSAIDPSLGRALGGGVRVKRLSGRGDWLALVSPYPRFLDHLPIPVPAAVVRILGTDSHSSLSPEHAELFSLTGRETDVASALLGGHSLESLSAVLGISRNTARVHLQGLFRKTGTSRQSDLVRVLGEVARH